jgi:regulation of enolase protein 1 (concanavalin A-like superfamily)
MIRRNFVSLMAITLVVIFGGFGLKTANAIHPALSISFGANRNNVEPGFTRFLVTDSGNIVNGIQIDLALMMPPVEGTWTPAWNARDRTGWSPTTAQWTLLYNQLIFARPGGIRITLTGLETSTPYQLEIWDFDVGSANDRIADVNVNDVYCMTIQTNSGSPPVTGLENYYTGTCTSDVNGVMVTELWPNPATDELAGSYNPYAIINAFRLTPINVSPIATNPVPQTGSTIDTTQPDFQWEPGIDAVSHDVYLSTVYDDVKNATRDAPLGVLVEQGIEPNSYDPGVLQADTTYYWRIDEVKSSIIEKGNVWNFYIPPITAYNPSPVNGVLFADANFPDPAVFLSWYQAADTTSYHVYFGDNLQNVQAGTGGTDKGTVTNTNYDLPSMLELNKTYYWRVDSFDGTTTNIGAVWSFKTSPAGLGTIEKDIWENVTSNNVLTVLTSDTRYPYSPTVTETLTSFDTGSDGYGLANYGGQLSGWLYVPLTGNYTFWLNTAGQGELWLSTDEDADNLMPQYLDHETVWGTYGGFSHFSNPIPLIGGNRYYIRAIWVSVDWDYCEVAWQGAGIRDQEIIRGCYLSPYNPVQALGPNPRNDSTNINQTPILKWRPGKYAASHDIYFGSDPNALSKVATNPLGQEQYGPISPALDPNQTYYWRIDEVNDLNPASPWLGKVWSFTTAPYLVVDDFEYYDDTDNRIYNTWGDYYVNNTGMTVGHLDPPFAERSIIHYGSQAMYMRYDNDGTVNEGTDYEQGGTLYYSEAEREWEEAQDWTAQGATSLSLWFRGIPPVYGSFNAGPPITITARGADIFGTADQFHFAYKQLSGVGSITARVVSVSNSDPWAKAGVMIRESLEPGSVNVMIAVTPGNGVTFQNRTSAGADSVSTVQAGITAPQWVRLTRSGNTFTGEYSANGSNWTALGSVDIAMLSEVYIGLCLTSHNVGATCTAEFSNVNISGTVAGDWQSQDIGIESNIGEKLYVALQDSAGNSAVVTNPDPAATTVSVYTQWSIPLTDFTNVNLRSIKKMSIGVGSRGSMQPGSAGDLYIDDIGLELP